MLNAFCVEKTVHEMSLCLSRQEIIIQPHGQALPQDHRHPNILEVHTCTVHRAGGKAAAASPKPSGPTAQPEHARLLKRRLPRELSPRPRTTAPASQRAAWCESELQSCEILHAKSDLMRSVPPRSTGQEASSREASPLRSKPHMLVGSGTSKGEARRKCRIRFAFPPFMVHAAGGSHRLDPSEHSCTNANIDIH